MPVSILEDDLALSPLVDGGLTPDMDDPVSDDDIVVVEDHRAGLTDAIGMPPSQPYSPPVYFRYVGPNYIPQGDEMMMTRRVAVDSGFVELPISPDV